jgi:hypothetical protein
MSGRPCLLCFCVSLAIVIFTISVAAQDTPVDSAAKAPASATPAASDTTAFSQGDAEPGGQSDQRMERDQPLFCPQQPAHRRVRVNLALGLRW